MFRIWAFFFFLMFFFSWFSSFVRKEQFCSLAVKTFHNACIADYMENTEGIGRTTSKKQSVAPSLISRETWSGQSSLLHISNKLHKFIICSKVNPHLTCCDYALALLGTSTHFLLQCQFKVFDECFFVVWFRSLNQLTALALSKRSQRNVQEQGGAQVY